MEKRANSCAAKKHRPRVLVVGSFVMDLIVSSNRFPQSGETVIGCSFQTATGGKGANQAVQAARLGADVTMVGKVGADAFGTALINSAKEAGVNVEHVIVSRESSSGVGNVQLEVGNGQTSNRIVVVPGANMTITPEEIAFLKEDIAKYDLVILQLEIPVEINQQVAAYAKAKGVPVMLNSAPYAPIPPELLSSVTYISPNEHEAALMTGISVDSEENTVRVLKAIRGMGVSNALITLGSRGVAYLDNKDQLTVSPALKGLDVKDPTAAGDSFVGAFSTAVCLGIEMKHVLSFANHTAAITVCRMGAQPSLPTIDEVLALMRERYVDTSLFEVLEQKA